MDYELSIDPKIICRCCLAEHPSLKTIFCNEIVNGSIVPFPSVFECVTEYKASKDDGFPEKLCSACRQIINDSYVLKQKFKSNRQLLSDILKIELHDVATDKPKTFVSAGIQTIPSATSGDHIGTQTDDLPQSDKPSPMVCTQSTSMQTVAQLTETVRTQTEPLPIKSGKHTQTDTARSLTACTQTLVVRTQNTVTQTSSDATSLSEASSQFKIEALGAEHIELDIVDDTLDEEMHSLHCEDDEPAVNEIIPPVEPSPTADEESQIVEFVFGEPNAVADEEDDGIEYLLDDAHSVDTAAEEPLICSICNSDFESADALAGHQLTGCSAVPLTLSAVRKPPTMRAPKSTEGAPRSRKRTQSASTAAGAVSTTTTAATLFCTLCTFAAKTDREFGVHVHGHKRWLPLLLDSVYYFRCTDCHAVYLSADELDDHWREPHACHKPDEDEDEMAESCTDYQYLDDEWLDIGCEGELDLENPALLNLVQRLCSGTRTDDHQHFECDRCEGFAVETAAELWMHFGDVHFRAGGDDETKTAAGGDLDDIDPEYLESFGAVHKCGYCTKAFRTVRTAVAHVFFHAAHFVCPYDSCGDVSFQQYLQLGQHLNRQHGKQRQNDESGCFTCGFCAVEYAVYADYRTHLRMECPGRLFVCEVCDKRFFSRHHLETHMKYHNNVRRYKCQYCDKRFTQSGDQRIHERIHTGDKPFKCPFCPKTFRSIGNRKDHVATHDPTNKVTCNECGLQFKSDRILRGHMAIHSTDKRFKCTTCGKEFYRKYHLTKHQQTHTTGRVPAQHSILPD